MELVEARRRGADTREVEQRLAAARTTLDSLESFKFEVRALPPADWEALVAQHPAAKDADHGWDFDPPTFWPALLEASVIDLDAGPDDPPMTAQDWADMFAQGEVNLAEKNALLNTALGLNTRSLGVQVGKGSAQTPS
ncbi:MULTISPECIES: hypothetical protein [Pseudonocardia]|uniref:hypothetical protein n=1 Tax=Pseudonocardia TaxID=1847 RepID=UPI000F78B881|nr:MULTISPECIES: hypothetical protein [Pseudonocardia]